MLAKRYKKKKSSSVFTSAIFLIIILMITGFLAYSNWKIVQRKEKLSDEVQALEKDIHVLEERNQALEAQISQSQSQDFLEKEIRERLNLKKPGEEVVTILKPTPEPKIEEKKSFWQRIWDKLGF